MLLQQKFHRRHRVAPHKQSGAALLALMLVIIAGASYMLVYNLNANTRFYNRQIETASVLREAKAALLAYSVNYPEKYASSGPGVMPCPDLNNNGSASANCSYTGGTTLGRFPWKTVGVGEFKDHHGEHLWYIVSDNFRTPLVTQINSETPGTLKVDSNDDIVAVLIAPGAPITGQDRTGGPLLAINYLEGGNQVNDNNFVSRFAGEFNDQLVFITRKELMQVVEQRVINQARTALNEYFNTVEVITGTGAYPWLAPFADPKAGARWMKGTVSSTGSNLTDTSVDFIKWGVTAGDVVWNVTDGSHGVVSAVAANSLTLSGSGLGYGSNNTFSNNDEYYVENRNLAARFRGTASSGSTGLVLRDTSRDFDELLVSTGDIIDNITDGSSGMVVSALNDRITVASLAGGSTNSFSAGDSYRIRSNAGIAGTGSAGIVLADANVDFQLMNVQIGDLVRNVSLGTTGQVAIVNQHSLTVVGTTFNVGNHYSLSRFSGRAGTTQGLLPIHEPGSSYTAGFDLDWSFLISNGNTVTRTTSGGHSIYNSGLDNWTEASSGRLGTVTMASTGSSCSWVADKIVNCRGQLVDTEFLSGSITDTTATTLTDSSKNFPEAGIKRGDKVQNTSDNTWGIVTAATGANSNSLTVSNIYGWTALNKNAGQPYRVHVATSFTDGTATAPTAENVWRLYDNTGKLATATVGDIIENTRWNAIGIVTNVAFHATYGWYVDFTRLQGGTYTDYVSGETYRIHRNYVDRREYTFNLRLSGNIASTYSGGVRSRTLCRGYGSNCASAPAASTFRGNGLTELVTINDYRLGGTLLGSARLTVPAAGSPQSSVRISGLDYQLSETEFPDWFLSNRWHQLLYMAYSPELGPGGSGSCSPIDGNCLQMLQGNTTLDDRGALILAAGMQLDNVLCPDASVQNRINARLCDYFENENAISNNILRKEHASVLFNDRLISLVPSTY